MTLQETITKHGLAPDTIVYHNMPDIVACACAAAEWRKRAIDFDGGSPRDADDAYEAADAYQKLFNELKEKEAGDAE